MWFRLKFVVMEVNDIPADKALVSDDRVQGLEFPVPCISYEYSDTLHKSMNFQFLAFHTNTPLPYIKGSRERNCNMYDSKTENSLTLRQLLFEPCCNASLRTSNVRYKSHS